MKVVKVYIWEASFISSIEIKLAQGGFSLAEFYTNGRYFNVTWYDGYMSCLSVFRGNVTGASMNPARSLGPAVVYSPFISNGQPEVWTYHYVYWLGPLAGVFAAAFIYR